MSINCERAAAEKNKRRIHNNHKLNRRQEMLFYGESPGPRVVRIAQEDLFNRDFVWVMYNGFNYSDKGYIILLEIK